MDLGILDNSDYGGIDVDNNFEFGTWDVHQDRFDDYVGENVGNEI